ncbi:MAG TPA: N-acetyltransferase [Gammaproteobacteria bacterium]|nr:N-acetyltransferase [Gammaproteobacteria bacterium]
MCLLKQKCSQTQDLSIVEIESTRLKLVPVSRKFARDIFREFTADITRYMVPKPVDHIDEIYAFIDTSREKMAVGDQLVMAILETETGQFSGVCAIHGKEPGVTAELGIWLKKSSQGKKLGREAIMRLVQWARANLVLSGLVYPVDRDNIPSRKIAESLGGIVVAEGQRTSLSDTSLNEQVYRIDAGE